jgi:hypothetical protein
MVVKRRQVKVMIILGVKQLRQNLRQQPTSQEATKAAEKSALLQSWHYC